MNEMQTFVPVVVSCFSLLMQRFAVILMLCIAPLVKHKSTSPEPGGGFDINEEAFLWTACRHSHQFRRFASTCHLYYIAIT